MRAKAALFPFAPSARAASCAAVVPALLAGPGCILDFDGLATSSPPPAQDAAIDADAPDLPVDGSADVDSPDAIEAACSPLSCGACEPACAPDGCAPVVLATGPAVADLPRALALTQDSLAWVSAGSGQVARWLDSAAAPEILTPAESPVAIAASQNAVVWAERDGVFACDPSACESTRRQLGSAIAPGSVRAVALDGTTAYWTDQGNGAASDGAVRQCDLADCPSPDDITTTGFRPHGLAITAAHLLWTNQGDGFETGSVYRADRYGGNVVDVAQALRLPVAVAADDTYAYFVSHTTDGRVWRCAYLEGYCEFPTDIAPAAGDLGHPFAIELAGGRVWFATEDDGTIRSCPAPGCGSALPQVHVSGRSALAAFAVGSTCLFFADGEGGGSIAKVRR